MATRHTFSTTRWGMQWIDALENIDRDTNRLQRGRRYANNESVKSISVDQTTIQAKVKGSRPSPYVVKIKLVQFDKNSKQQLKNLILENPSILSQLTLGKLPEELEMILKDNQIPLYPTKWKDIHAECSCPDYANPCKHIAAVYYLIAREIDKNPFLLFNLKGIETKELTGIKENVGYTKKQVPFSNYYLNISKAKYLNIAYSDIDLSLKETDVEPIFSLLPSKPTFYLNSDFKALLKKAYRFASIIVNHKMIDENYDQSLKKSEIRLLYMNSKPYFFICTNKNPESLGLSPKAELTQIKIPINDMSNNKIHLVQYIGYIVSIKEAVNFFRTIPIQFNETDSSPSFRFMSFLVGFCVSIVRTSSYLPDTVWNTDESFTIVYEVHSRINPIQSIWTNIGMQMPSYFGFVPDEKKLLNLDGVKKLIPLFIKSILEDSLSLEFPIYEDKLLNTFFSLDGEFTPEKFEEKLIGKSVNDWIEHITTIRGDIAPVLKLDFANDEHFDLSIEIENRKNPMDLRIPLSKIFEDQKKFYNFSANELRINISRQLSIVGEFIPEVKEILNTKGRLSKTLDSILTMTYLTKHSEKLDLLGITFIIPKELKNLIKPKPIMKISASSNNQISFMNLDSILDFSYGVSLGDKLISVAEFKNLLKKAEGLIRFKGEYLLIDPEEAKKILEKLSKPNPLTNKMDILRMILTESNGGFDIRLEKNLKVLLENLTKEEKVSIPVQLNANLRPYQIRGYQWIYSNIQRGFGVCIADDMGLGKTVQVIAVLQKMKEDSLSNVRTLIVCPTTLIGNWKKETERFAPNLKVSIYHGTERSLKSMDYDLMITSYGMVRRDLSKFKSIDWNTLVLDEAQNIKNNETDQTKSVKTLNSKYYITMTGTPVENRLLELWSIFDFLNKGYLKDPKWFKENYSIPIERYRDKSSIQKLKQATSPFILRRLKTDKTIIDDLPDKIISNEYCYLSKEQTALYEAITKKMLNKIMSSSEQEKGMIVLQLITYLKQICNHPVQYSKNGSPKITLSGKAEKLIELLSKIQANQEKVLIFTQYKEMGDLLSQMIQEELNEESLFFHGSLTRMGRDKLIEKFKVNPDNKILIISLKAGGTGLNLVNANHVIHYDLWWNPAVEAQATDRAFRIGQTKNVNVHRLISIGTVEEKIDALMQNKKELADLTINVGENWIGQMSKTELKKLFELG